MKKRIMIVHPSEIVRRGIMSLVQEASDMPCEFVTPSRGEASLDEADVFIVDSDFLACQPELFLKRKERVAVILQMVQSDNVKGVFDSITLAMPVEEIKKVLARLLACTGNVAEQVHAELSNREIEVLREIGRGKSFKEIADTLFISVNTVTTHRKNISAKLGIRTVSGLSVYAHLNNIVADEIV